MNILIFFLFVLGTAVGSFLNVVIDRLSFNQSLGGRSHCDYCQHQLAWCDLIPLLSFFFLKGECRYCSKKFSFFYPLVELSTGIVFVFAGLPAFRGVYPFLHLDLAFLFLSLSIASSLLVIFFSDLKYQLISDLVQFYFFGSVFLLKIVQKTNLHFLFSNFISGLVVMSPILFLYLITKRKGMGFGDVQLSFIIGFWLGIKTSFLALYFAFVIGAIVGIALLIMKKKSLKSKVAFGPFIILGTLIMILFGEKVFTLIKNF